eukprot:CAMPEP_0171082064 /NCGR_PEP_ID=MMETSP0766_2-20121228/16876_1 /TAXON_ID=439317 /ORGANISM="Gambierdiscus australes, Strain CAWD 149" /LENGTH=282 /DNA_ID=CAMNT_0011539401 /DNA_START=59 /DNA_END=907 /DNA_ORIENTATION=-
MAAEQRNALPRVLGAEANLQAGSLSARGVASKVPGILSSISELPTTCEGRVIVAVKIAEVPNAREDGEANEEQQDDDPPAWLPVTLADAVEINADWLDERTLRRLVKDIVTFARAAELADVDPDCWFKGERYLPLVLFIVAFVLTGVTVFNVVMSWGFVFLFGCLAVVTFCLGLCAFSICLVHHERVIGSDPEALCSDFAGRWTAEHGLSLSFHRRVGGPSYFELQRPPRPAPPTLQLGQNKEKEEDDDGWSMVRTPTASSAAKKISTASGAPGATTSGPAR